MPGLTIQQVLDNARRQMEAEEAAQQSQVDFVLAGRNYLRGRRVGMRRPRKKLRAWLTRE